MTRLLRFFFYFLSFFSLPALTRILSFFPSLVQNALKGIMIEELEKRCSTLLKEFEENATREFPKINSNIRKKLAKLDSDGVKVEDASQQSKKLRQSSSIISCSFFFSPRILLLPTLASIWWPPAMRLLLFEYVEKLLQKGSLKG